MSNVIYVEDYDPTEKFNHVCEEFNDIVHLLHSHVFLLTSDQTEWKEVRYPHENVLPKLLAYRKNVEEARNSRRAQRTWVNRDVSFHHNKIPYEHCQFGGVQQQNRVWMMLQEAQCVIVFVCSSQGYLLSFCGVCVNKNISWRSKYGICATNDR